MANILKYTDAVGPAFVDGTTTFTFTLDTSGLAASRTLIVPDAAGTIALTSGLTIYAPLASPTFTGTPAAPTATAGANSTQVATTAYADRFNGDPQFSIPVAAGTVSPTATGNEIHVHINPAGTLASLTLTLPTGTIKGQRLYATFTQIITTLTVTGTNVDTKGKVAPTAAAVGDTFGYVWDSVSTKWNRFV